MPGQFNFITIDVGTLRLIVTALYDVSVREMPRSFALWLVVTESTLEEGSIRVDPLAGDNHAVFEFADVFLAGLAKHVSALAFFFAVDPVARVDVLVDICHDAFAVALTVLPVAVVFANADVVLLADA